MSSGSGNQRPIIIVRKKKAGEAAHHGGAWKVAYADFVTAMMAFFLVLWLVTGGCVFGWRRWLRKRKNNPT